MTSYIFDNSSGIISVDTLTTLADVQQEIKNATGNQNLTVDKGPLAAAVVNPIAEQRDGGARADRKSVV